MTPEEQKQFDERNRIEEMVHAIRAHAITHYNEGGWDNVVECYEDSDIVNVITESKAKTAEQAIKYLGGILKVVEDYGDDIRATAF